MKNNLFKNVKTELKKVIWPTKQQLLKNTILVIVLVLAFAALVLTFDMIVDFVDMKIWNLIKEKLI
jgi:preprotein translocase subunit SecE